MFVFNNRISLTYISFRHSPALSHVLGRAGYIKSFPLRNFVSKSEEEFNFEGVQFNEPLAFKYQIECVKKRDDDLSYIFDDKSIDLLNKCYDHFPMTYNKQAFIINPDPAPEHMFESKESDYFMIKLWNTIFKESFHIRDMEELKPMAETIIKYYDNLYPYGTGMTEAELIRYVTAHSSSSFIGIQREQKSIFALESMKKTLEAHANAKVIDKPWLIEGLGQIQQHISRNRVMSKSYADILENAKASSTSIPNETRNYRDFVFELTMNELIYVIKNMPEIVPFIIVAGKRNDRRGKFRLICSFNAYFRIVDFLINNGSYDICSHGGIWSQYTTEGYDNSKMWPELKKMAYRENGYVMICLDYSGYDTQISLLEYLEISAFLNSYRLGFDDDFQTMFSWYELWLKQPKFLVSESRYQTKELLIPYYRTLASGLHGTHSFENIMGISFALHAKQRGVDVLDFWTNGDDQNFLVKTAHESLFMDLVTSYHQVSEEKSLIGHSLSVWGKKWVTQSMYPVIEIGTIRSIWEKETSDPNIVEPSKFENSYAKILQLIMFLIRLEVSQNIIMEMVKDLCYIANIDYTRIPVSLRILKQIKAGKVHRNNLPAGLQSEHYELNKRTIYLDMLEANNMYDMLAGMYRDNTFFSLEVDETQYHEEGFVGKIISGLDYSKMEEQIPFIFRDLKRNKIKMDSNQDFVRNVLQSSGSFDGPVDGEYTFNDMYSLAMAIHLRNAR